MWNDSERRLVVNEIETIEADYKFNEALDRKVFHFLFDYWLQEVDKCVIQKISSTL